ncbi:hypothetical protein NX059_010400 [Plenodomus lindquistii]|nr:hypothetical protein NX059_010400 [Plenodomus lindquistii]
MADAPQVAYENGPVQADWDQYKYLHTTGPDSTVQDGATDGGFAQPSHADKHQDTTEEELPKSSTILGLRSRNFWILVVLAIAFVAIAIGGSVGGTLAVQNKSSTPTTDPSATSVLAVDNYTPLPPSAVTSINITCPERLRSYDGGIYDCVEEYNAKWVGDITGVLAYTLQQCVDACTTYNKMQGTGKCTAVVLDRNMAQKYAANNGATCWLKNMSDPAQSYPNTTMARLVS